MKFAITSVLSLMVAAPALASQLQFNRNEEPVCYRGNAKSALKELLAIDVDPALSGGRILKGSRDGATLIYAHIIDENGWLVQKYVLAPCK